METDDQEAVLVFQVDQVVEPPIEVTNDPKLRNKVIFANELANLWVSQCHMDVDLVCTGNEVVRAHRLVLAALSPFFRRIFVDFGPQLETDISISLSEVEAKTLRSCLEKIYLGDNSIATIDESLYHLAFSGEILSAQSLPADTLQEVIHATIKSEQGVFDEFDDYIGGPDSLSVTFVPAANKKAKIWKHYTQKDKESALCKICQIVMRTKNGCTSGMSRHILRAHPDLQDDVEEEDTKEEPMEDLEDDLHQDGFNVPSPPPIVPEETTAVAAPVGKAKKSKVWNFYIRLEKDTAKCKACEMTIKTQKGNTTGMTRHLFRAHLDLYSQLEAMREKEQGGLNSGDSEDDDDDFSPFKGISVKVKRKKPSKKGGKNKKQTAAAAARAAASIKTMKVWQYFEQPESNANTEVQCNTCLQLIKTDPGKTAGLVSHLQSNHPEQYDEFNSIKNESVGHNEEAGGDKFPQAAVRNSPVWQFYQEIGSNRVKCLKCNVILKYYYGTTSGLLRHLRRSHQEDYESIKNDENAPGGNGLSENTSVSGASATASGAYQVDNETIWKFFHKAEVGDKANCVECMAEITNDHASLVTSCEEHLRALHTEILEQYESQRKAYVQELIKMDKTAIKRRYTSRVCASTIWSFFRKTDDPTLNQCSTCLLDIDCSQNTTAMVKHLEEAHPEQHDAFKKQSGIEAKDIKKPSAIWKHFQPTTDPKKHKCMVRF
jgi:hypothetical protein